MSHGKDSKSRIPINFLMANILMEGGWVNRKKIKVISCPHEFFRTFQRNGPEFMTKKIEVYRVKSHSLRRLLFVRNWTKRKIHAKGQRRIEQGGNNLSQARTIVKGVGSTDGHLWKKRN